MKPTRLAVTSCVTAVLLSGQGVLADWPEWRGARRDGTSTEKNLPAAWSPAGDNLAWKAPYGGRSGPVVFGDRVYLNTVVGTGDSVQERLVALDANTGKLVWEQRFNVFHSDVPAHRSGWAAPSVDPGTGIIYTFGVGGLLTATTPAGKPQWHRSLSEDYGLVSTHGGRTVSPIVEGNLVIVNALCVGWGDLGPRRQPLVRLRQGHGRDGLGQLAAEAALRHQHVARHRHDRQRHEAADRRRHRRHVPRPQGQHRRAGVGVRSQQARDPHRRGAQRHHGLHHAQRGEPRHVRDGNARGARRRQRAARWRATRTRSGSTTASRAASPRRSPTASGSTWWTTARFWGRSI